MLRDGPVPARVHPWPGVDGVAQLVVLDSSAVPMPAHFARWGAQLAELGYHTIRTGALAPRAAAQAASAGMRCIQELALLEATAPFPAPRRRGRTRRVNTADFVRLAEIDRAAFGERWSLDAAMLRDVTTATPLSRVRGVRARDLVDEPARASVGVPVRRSWIGFLLSGRSGTTGYVQRLAVDPAAQRRGAAVTLLDDAFEWFRRGRCQRALVNTDVANGAALALYRSHGFRDLSERLRVFEGPTAGG